MLPNSIIGDKGNGQFTIFVQNRNKMKKITLIFLQLLLVGYCFGQEIDKRALAVLQASFDKLATLKTIKYGMTFTDTMLRAPGSPRVQQTIVTGTIKKNGYWHLLFEDKSRWLIKGDTLYKRLQESPNAVSYTKDWHAHELAKFSIFNILGTERPTSDEKGTASLKFVQDTLIGDYYVIDEVSTKIDYQTDEIKDVIHYGRYWINKKSMLPLRRKMYGESMQNGRQAIDIYDFTISIDQVDQDYEVASNFFDNTTVMEQVSEHKNLETGTIAPAFTVTNLNTNKIVTLNDLKGKVVLLDFWYLSCMPCKILTPKIQKLYEKFSGKDVVVIGINPIDNSSNNIKAFLAKKMITFPQYYKAGNLAKAYKLYAYPTTMVIGKDGKIKLLEIGLSDDIEKRLEEMIEKELIFISLKQKD